MRAFMMYITDWKSSTQIGRMDAAEERGYLRLLLDAAEAPDCGLPDDDDALKISSLLKKQWHKLTADEDYQYGGQTSGQKVRACFFYVKDGCAFNAATDLPYEPTEPKKFNIDGCREKRLYNERLLREFRHQKEVSSKAKKSSQAAVNARRDKALADADKFLDGLADHPESRLPCPQSGPKQPNDEPNGQPFDEISSPNDQPSINKLSLSLSLKEASVETKTTNTENQDFYAAAQQFQTDDGFNFPAAFAYLAKNFHRNGRLRLEMAMGVFAMRIDEGPDRVSQFAAMLAGLSRWNASDLWKRGIVNHIANWLSERLYNEEPVSAARVEQEKQARKVAQMPPRKTGAADRLKAKALAKEEAEERRAS